MRLSNPHHQGEAATTELGLQAGGATQTSDASDLQIRDRCPLGQAGDRLAWKGISKRGPYSAGRIDFALTYGGGYLRAVN